IPVAGAVTGRGIESTPLRNGMPHESVTELEILTGDGRVVVATDDNEHADLFRGFPNSYGTLGYALSLTIELEPVRPYVHLRHFRFATPEACMAAVSQIAADGGLGGHRADFVDGTAFSPDEIYLTVGAYSEVAPWVSDYTGQVGMSPVWLCPLRLRGDQPWPLYPLRPGEVYVNFGFWGTVPLPLGRPDGHYNRLVEAEVAALGGSKGLYSTSFYSPEQFWA